MNLFFHELGDGEPLILLHGMFGMADNLMPIAREFAQNYKVYVPDLRNHGRSPWHEQMSFSIMAGDVVRLMEQQGIRKAHIMGHSLGGKVAMAIALEQPQWVKSLIVADISPCSYPPHHEQIIKGLKNVAQMDISSRRQADSVLSNFVEEEDVRRFLLKSLFKNEETELMQWRFNLNAVAANYHKLRESMIWDLPFEGDTLFIKAELSDYISREHEEPIRAAFPNFQFKMIQNVGHWLHAEKPDAFVKVVTRFLGLDVNIEPA